MSAKRNVVCPHCATTNAIPADRLGDKPKCGKCKQAVFDAHPVEFDQAGFQRHLSASDIPLLVDFWAPWCGPCLAMAPAFAQAAAELEPAIRLGKINTEVEQDIGAQHAIRSIPTMILFNKGREVARLSGAMKAADIVRWARAQLT